MAVTPIGAGYVVDGTSLTVGANNVISGTGTVSSVTDSSGFFSIANSTTTPTFTFLNAPANTVFGNNTSGSTTPGFQTSLNISGTAATAAHTVTSSSANALAVGPNGATNPAFSVDASTASSITGINIKSAVAGSGVVISSSSTLANEDITVQSKGTGSLFFNSGGRTQYNISSASGFFDIIINSSQIFTQNLSNISFNPAPSSTASTPRFGFTASTGDTSLTAGTESPDVYFNLGQTRQHASNTAITTQRDYRITGSTHSFVTAGGTITNAAAFAVDGPDSGGTNATITNSSGFYVPTTALSNVTNGYGLNVAAPTGATGINYAGQFTGNVGVAGGIISNGTKFTASGCSNSATVGGATAGTYTSGTTGTCTVVITMGNSATAPNGWDCNADDRTTVSDIINTIASTTTTATLAGTTVTGDVIGFHCVGY